jgi:hypothetical protein
MRGVLMPVGVSLPTQPERKEQENRMKQAFWAAAAIGMAWLLASMAPDIRRYLRISTM